MIFCLNWNEAHFSLAVYRIANIQMNWSKICNSSYINCLSVFNFWVFFRCQVKRIRDMHNVSLETAISFCVKIQKKKLKTRMQIWPCFIVSRLQLAGDQSIFIISIDGIVKIINNKFKWIYRRRRRCRQWANRLILEIEMSTTDKRFTTYYINASNQYSSCMLVIPKKLILYPCDCAYLC